MMETRSRLLMHKLFDNLPESSGKGNQYLHLQIIGDLHILTYIPVAESKGGNRFVFLVTYSYQEVANFVKDFAGVTKPIEEWERIAWLCEWYKNDGRNKETE